MTSMETQPTGEPHQKEKSKKANGETNQAKEEIKNESDANPDKKQRKKDPEKRKSKSAKKSEHDKDKKRKKSLIQKVSSSDSNQRSSQSKNTEGNLNAFLKAVIDGDEDTIQQLHNDSESCDIIASKDDKGHSCLHLAVLHNHPHCLKILLRLGASVSAQDDLGNSPIHLAVLKNSVECLQAMLQYLEESNTENRREKIRDLILQLNVKGNTAVLLAAKHNNTKLLSILLDHVADGNKNMDDRYDGELILRLFTIQNRNGNTILHQVVKSKDTTALKYLFQHVAQLDTNITNAQQMTPLHIAAIYGSLDAAKFLCESSCDVNAVDSKGNTPLHYAAEFGYEAIVSLLLRSGGKVVVHNNEKQTPMHLATQNLHDDVCYILTTNGADVSIRYQFGQGNNQRKKSVQNNNNHATQPADSDEENDDETQHPPEPKSSTTSATVQSDTEAEQLKALQLADRYGYIDDEEENHAPKVSSSSKERKLIEKERKRAAKWAPMITHWDHWAKKKKNQVKKRLIKGLPDCLRCEAWRKITRIEILKSQSDNVDKYHNLIYQESSWTGQIDLDVNRSARNHVQFKERFGPGQVSLFNILKAYSLYDPDVGYCQGMSDMTAFLLMYIPEEDCFWMLVVLLTTPIYNMRALFLPGFPMLQRTFWIWEKLLEKSCPQISKKFAKFNLSPTLYGMKWFLLVFLDAFPFSLMVRLWDIFLFKGYDFVFTIGIGLFKFLEKRLLSASYEEVVQILQSLPNQISISDDEFIEFIMKHKVESKTIRKLESQYHVGHLNPSNSNSSSVPKKKNA
mmetsp:Transcript_3274/g.4510  ORF Transcript_3274/g.4510 Transcript_3274/m.4510 type:complete len:795 (-) Transcript_3274:59-2443(-)